MFEKFYVPSQVYTDTFKNEPYSVSMFETTDVTTPDLLEYPSELYDRAMERRRVRLEKESAAHPGGTNREKGVT